MDRMTFDRLSVAISRRGVVRGIAAMVAGGTALAGADGTLAVTRRTCRQLRQSCTRNDQCCGGYCERRKSVQRRDRFRCACGIGYGLCDGVCTELGTDEHCSSCGDACTALETCFSGACTDVCDVLVCDVDETCYAGACRDLCVTGSCASGQLCIVDANACLPTQCLADPSFSQAGWCLTLRDGTIRQPTVSYSGGSCSSDAQCEAYFQQENNGLQATYPDNSYGVSCVASAVFFGDEDPNKRNSCVEYVY